METWNLIVQSNTFNFLILIAAIAVLVKSLRLSSKLDNACKKIEDTIETSKKEKENSRKNLNEAREKIKNLSLEIEEIFKKTDINIQNAGEKLRSDTDIEVENIFSNGQKIIQNEDRKTVFSLKQKTALAAIEVARGHIINKIAQKPEYHKIFIQKSIDELDGLKVNER